MDSGYYAACTGLRAQNQALEIIANNLANVSTTGYRGQKSSFQTLLASGPQLRLSEVNHAINDFNVLNEGAVDLNAGSLQRTGNQLDVAIEGDAFFAVQTPAGILYTRAGNFHVSAAGQLLTSAGDPVLGAQGQMTLPSGDAAISGDGTISVNGAMVDQIRIARFPLGTALASVGNSYYATNKSATPLPAPDARVRQGMLEDSNVSAVKAVVQLINVQRQAEMLQRAMSVFYSELNHTAASDLPRVS